VNVRNFRLKSCRRLPVFTLPLAQAQIEAGPVRLPGWRREEGATSKTVSFGSYAETMAFANGAAGVARREDHQVEIQVGHDECSAAHSTHCVGGIPQHDFICAAGIEALCRI